MIPVNVLLVALSFGLSLRAQSYSATYLPSNAPNHSEKGQIGTNKCGTAANQTSLCQNAYLNSLDDFCLFAPPKPGKGSAIGDSEQIEVSWCMKDGYGTRLIPDGSIHGAHFVQTPDFVQITGTGALTSLNIPKGDEGGELDPHGADGNGNPIGGLVFSSAFGNLEQIHEWTNYMSSTEFCFRACKPGPKAPQWCEHVYDLLGCEWNMPANYAAGTFEQCLGDSGLPMGVYGSSTFEQGAPNTPPPHPIPKSSSCSKMSTIKNGAIITGSSILPSTTSTSISITATSTSLSSATATGKSSGGVLTIGLPGWERFVITAGTLLIGSMVGAVIVL